MYVLFFPLLDVCLQRDRLVVLDKLGVEVGLLLALAAGTAFCCVRFVQLTLDRG